MESIPKRLVIVGDSDCGKTRVLIAISKNQFPDDDARLPFRDYKAQIEINGEKIPFELTDTPGLECYDQIRTLSYEDVDVVLACFSIASPESLENISKKWVPEVRKYCHRGVPIILVGTKKDLRSDFNTMSELAKTHQRPVTFEEGQAVAEQIDAQGYFECSAKTRENIREVFEYAATKASQVQNGGGEKMP